MTISRIRFEEWKEIEDFPGYSISNLGRIKSFKQQKIGKILKPILSGTGYFCIHLSGQTVNVHILVAENFIGPKPSPKHQVNHKDGIKINNFWLNLEWVTPAENLKHSRLTGLFNQVKGEQHGCSKLTEGDVNEIKRLFATGEYTQEQIGNKFGVHQVQIGRILNNKNWKEV